MKTLILVWTQSPSNVKVIDSEWRFGIGDLLRGSIGAIQYCEKYGYECIIDISLHPISTLLNVCEHKYSKLIQQNKDNIYAILPNNVHQHVQDVFKDKDVVYFFSNFGLDVFGLDPSNKVKEYITTLLSPNSMFSDYIDTMMKHLPWNKFDILHFRLGDSEVINEYTKTDYTSHINHLTKYIEGHNILLSDSCLFKEFVAKNTDIFMYDQPVAHLGFHSNVDKIKHTMFEFILLTKAQKIKTYSVYGWTSGFVKIANYIYNVPLIKL